MITVLQIATGPFNNDTKPCCLATGCILLCDAVKRHHMHLTKGERDVVILCMQFSTAAVHAAEEQREVATKEAHRQALFPSLSSSSTPVKPAQFSSTGQSPRCAACCAHTYTHTHALRHASTDSYLLHTNAHHFISCAFKRPAQT